MRIIAPGIPVGILGILRKFDNLCISRIPQFHHLLSCQMREIAFIDVMSDEGFKRVFGVEENMILLLEAAFQDMCPPASRGRPGPVRTGTTA